MAFKDNVSNMISRKAHGSGSWILLRHFSETPSKYWNDRTKEAVGGPAFEYTDTVMLAGRQLTFEAARPPSQAGLNVMESVNALIETYRFYLPAGTDVKEDDEIFDLDTVGDAPTSVDYTNSGTGAKILARYKVKFPIKFQGNRGEQQYIVAISRRSEVR